MILAIAEREARALFRTPVAWSLLAIAQFLFAYQFLARIELYTEFSDKLRALPEAPGITELVVSPLFGSGAMLLLFVAPLVTMNTIAGERRSGTLALLYSSPVSSWQIVCGKYLGVGCLVLGFIALVALMPLWLLWGTRLDLGLYAAGLGAMLLVGATFSAVGVMFSALCSQAILAAVLGIGTLLGLWVLDWASRVDQDAGIFSYLASVGHFQRIAEGYISLSDVAYFVVLTIAALLVAVWRLAGDRKAL